MTKYLSRPDNSTYLYDDHGPTQVNIHPRLRSEFTKPKRWLDFSVSWG